VLALQVRVLRQLLQLRRVVELAAGNREEVAEWLVLLEPLKDRASDSAAS
jgi:hypothetical protein